ncbi:peptidyl-tRNA hydrolase domain-containing protein [Xylaria bambusicola]|uniref:peptidyl-tRNA hydrolase domain-containing protein n=1 Tax=Xylaria bambusicola TaxID=326684 RepID=UPI0020089B0E|nr:peptidyl-tRNA hydrolase domain-containing protein [Xylaria bambusicola]KAI0517057.1 peptidyl-tRNA hydrolase domain-containing protein [Xylaria bambusicola]
MPPCSLTAAARLPLLAPSVPSSLGLSLVHVRRIRYQPHDAWLDQDDINEAYKWHASFTKDSLPKPHNTYSRSSGPGGQHVNKTESKVTSVWPLSELCKGLPKLMRDALRSSRYYVDRSDSIMFHSQTERSRTANADENPKKMFNEIVRIFHEVVPAPTSETKRKKHEAAEKAFHQRRLKEKRHMSSKKASRKGGE